MRKKKYFYQQHVGETRDVLFEEYVENGMMHGFTENYIRVAAKYDPILINEIKNVRLMKINENGFVEVEDSGKVLRRGAEKIEEAVSLSVPG